MQEGLESASYRVQQLSLLPAVAKAFGWNEAQMQEACFPPPGLQQKMVELWKEKPRDWGALCQPCTIREKIESRIFDEHLASGGRNDRALKRHDPAIMRMVDGMIEEYSLCLYWDMLAFRAYKESTPQDWDTYRDRTHTIEGVRAQIAAHYSHELKEKGYSTTEATKIVGNAIFGYLSLGSMFSNRVAAISVAPEKCETPELTLQAIESHAKISVEYLAQKRLL